MAINAKTQKNFSRTESDHKSFRGGDQLHISVALSILLIFRIISDFTAMYEMSHSLSLSQDRCLISSVKFW